MRQSSIPISFYNMTCLLDLLTETLQNIAQYLTNSEIQSSEDNAICCLRLTCRALWLRTEYEFARTAFSTLRLDLYSNSLQRLLNISKRPAFGRAVKKLVFAHRQHTEECVAFSQAPDGEAGGLMEQVLSVLGKIFEEIFTGTSNLKDVVVITPCEARFRRHDNVPPVAFMAMDRASNDAILIEEVRIRTEVL
jgi:hypothetical protein